MIVDAKALLAEHFPALRFRDVRVVDHGWDSLVLDIDNKWIVRLPRRPEIESAIEREVVLLPELAPTLPVAVPHFELIARNGLVCVGYRKLPGSPVNLNPGEQTGIDLGAILSALHSFPVERARDLGIPYFDPTAWEEHFTRICDDFRQRVFPLLHPPEQMQAEAVFAGAHTLHFVPALLHGDLGPDHVLCRHGHVVSIIDWSDARVGDPALDLSWCLNGTPVKFADALALSYDADTALRRRSLFYHQLGPWYEVTYGLDTNQERFVKSGIDGVRSRLPL